MSFIGCGPTYLLHIELTLNNDQFHDNSVQINYHRNKRETLANWILISMIEHKATLIKSSFLAKDNAYDYSL